MVALLLMRHAVLQPGQAVFMPAGGLHAYLRGTGIELLANSDNVVRSGLTGKHIDVPELLKLLDPAVEVPILAPRVLPDGITWFATPVPEFRLHVIDAVSQPRLERGHAQQTTRLARRANPLDQPRLPLGQLKGQWHRRSHLGSCLPFRLRCRCYTLRQRDSAHE